MTHIDFASLLAEIEAAIPLATWTDATSDDIAKHGAQAREGRSGEWVILVVEFLMPDGYPPGSPEYAYDGTARKGATIVHLTSELAKTAWKASEK